MATQTFGNTTQESTGVNNEGVIYGYNATGVAGQAQSITVYFNDTDAHTAKCALYLASDNSLVATTEEKTLSAGAGWITFNFGSPPTLSAVTYRICAWSNSGTGTNSLYYATETGVSVYQTLTYGNWPNPGDFTSGNRRLSIYCTVSTSSGGIVRQVIMHS